MTPLEAILKIKAMFAEVGVQTEPAIAEPAPSVPATESVKEYKLKSGPKVLIDKLEVGGKVVVVDEVGAQMPAPAGEHELVDGLVIIVDEAGSIVEVKEPSSEEPIPAEEPVAASEPVQDDVNKKIEEMQKELDELKKKQSMASEAVAKFSTGVQELSDIVIAMMQTASAEATETPKNTVKQYETNEEKIQKFLEFAKTLKK
jgi:flagellar hook-basal body complex protein FliE